VPAGATPKDGPSAGVAMFVALASLLGQRPVRADVAMTGEISLRGLVLPIGGVKEKVLAALRAGITTVLLPERNRRDLDDVPASARERLRFEWLHSVDDALRVALESGARRRTGDGARCGTPRRGTSRGTRRDTRRRTRRSTRRRTRRGARDGATSRGAGQALNRARPSSTARASSHAACLSSRAWPNQALSGRPPRPASRRWSA